MADDADGTLYRGKCSRAYLAARAITIGQRPISAGKLSLGQVTVTLAEPLEKVMGLAGLEFRGSLVGTGKLSGMAKMIAMLHLNENTEFEYRILGQQSIQLAALHTSDVNPPSENGAFPPSSLVDYTEVQPPSPVPAPSPSLEKTGAFTRHRFRHLHIEAFEPTNLANWEPETETDVHMAFGVLQDATDYRYCCGVSDALLSRLDPEFASRWKGETKRTKPDAILIFVPSDEYCLAEWKMRSSDFKRNHAPDDVDVLVCWEDDEPDRTTVPEVVLALKQVARTVALTEIQDASFA